MIKKLIKTAKEVCVDTFTVLKFGIATSNHRAMRVPKTTSRIIRMQLEDYIIRMAADHGYGLLVPTRKLKYTVADLIMQRILDVGRCESYTKVLQMRADGYTYPKEPVRDDILHDIYVWNEETTWIGKSLPPMFVYGLNELQYKHVCRSQVHIIGGIIINS